MILAPFDNELRTLRKCLVQLLLVLVHVVLSLNFLEELLSNKRQILHHILQKEIWLEEDEKDDSIQVCILEFWSILWLSYSGSDWTAATAEVLGLVFGAQIGKDRDSLQPYWPPKLLLRGCSLFSRFKFLVSPSPPSVDILKIIIVSKKTKEKKRTTYICRVESLSLIYQSNL